VWVLFLSNFGVVNAQQKISATQGGLGVALESFDYFGTGLANVGDMDGDGIDDLAVGAQGDDDGGGGGIFADHGAVYVLLMNGDGTVALHQKISDTVGGFAGALNDLSDFGLALAPLGDLDGDGFLDLAVGAARDDDGGGANSNRGAVWVLFLDGMSVLDVGDDPLSSGAFLSQSPNPFTASTTFYYSAPRVSVVRARIYDSQGRIVVTLVDRRVVSGRYSVVWDGRDQHGRMIPTGTYFARFEVDGDVRARRVVFVQ
jgi:hypothetical protein